MKIKMNRKVKRILSIVLGIAVLAGAIALVANLVKPKNDDNGLKEIHPTFEVGGLNETGEFVDIKESLYTKKAIEYSELKVSLDFDADVTYQLFYYDADDKFVSASEVLTKGHTEVLKNETKFVRILVTPVYADATDEDKEIKWYEIRNYAKQLTISTKVNEIGVVYIDGYELKFVYEEGMTWEDLLGDDILVYFVDQGDEYGIVNDYGVIRFTGPGGADNFTLGNTLVKPSDEIVLNGEYYLAA